MPSSRRPQLDVHLTPIVPTDVQAILQLERECFSDPWSIDELRSVLAGATIMVARHERRVVGYTAICFAHRRIEIWNLAVDPNHRRRGIGRRLIEHAKGRLETYKLRSIRVEVLDRDRDAQEFFRAMDFRPVRSRICCDPTIRYSFRRRDIGLDVLRSLLEGDERVVQF